MFEDTASALFGVEGLRVTDVQAWPDGVLEVWAVADDGAAAAGPDCGVVSGRVHETVLARPRDVRRAAIRWTCGAKAANSGGFFPDGVNGALHTSA